MRLRTAEGTAAVRLGRVRSLTARVPQVRGPYRDSAIVLRDLQPLSEYCLRVQAHLLWKAQDLDRPGLASNISCHETAADGEMCSGPSEPGKDAPEIVTSGSTIG